MNETGSTLEESKGEQVPYPLSRVPHDRVKYVPGGIKGWHFIFVNDSNPAISAESSKIQSYLRGIQQVPDMIYGQNRLYLIHPSRDFLYSFSPLDAL